MSRFYSQIVHLPIEIGQYKSTDNTMSVCGCVWVGVGGYVFIYTQIDRKKLLSCLGKPLLAVSRRMHVALRCVGGGDEAMAPTAIRPGKLGGRTDERTQLAALVMTSVVRCTRMEAFTGHWPGN